MPLVLIVNAASGGGHQGPSEALKIVKRDQIVDDPD